jgi:hypothetical protein
MPYQIMVQGDSAPNENAAVVAAFNALIVALRAGTSKHVDAGGTTIDAAQYHADETIATDEELPQGTAW